LDYGAVGELMAPRANRKVHITCDFPRYRDSNRIERMFGYLKHMRASAPGMIKRPCHSHAFSKAAIRRRLKDFVNTT
jgi:hypothetical protein